MSMLFNPPAVPGPPPPPPHPATLAQPSIQGAGSSAAQAAAAAAGQGFASTIKSGSEGAAPPPVAKMLLGQ